jgi:hypothetical protein
MADYPSDHFLARFSTIIRKNREKVFLLIRKIQEGAVPIYTTLGKAGDTNA